LEDVLFLKGIDMGVVDEDNLWFIKRRGSVAGQWRYHPHPALVPMRTQYDS
jgi:hypothetical protein